MPFAEGFVVRLSTTRRISVRVSECVPPVDSTIVVDMPPPNAELEVIGSDSHFATPRMRSLGPDDIE